MSYSTARIAALKCIASHATPFILNHATDERIILLTRVLARVARTERHKAQLRALRDLIESDHPAKELAHRLFALHPKVGRSFVNSLGINATWLGEQERRAFAFQIYTNGICIDDATIERLQRCGNVAPAFSLEGEREQTDFRRGKGVYDRVMATMDACREAGLLFGFSATTAAPSPGPAELPTCVI